MCCVCSRMGATIPIQNNKLLSNKDKTLSIKSFLHYPCAIERGNNSVIFSIIVRVYWYIANTFGLKDYTNSSKKSSNSKNFIPTVVLGYLLDELTFVCKQKPSQLTRKS